MKFTFNSLLITGILIATGVDLGVTAYITYWREVFWSAVEHRQLTTFIWHMIYFAIAAGVSCLMVGLVGYWISLLALNIRKHLTHKLINAQIPKIEGIEQRIQEDCRDYPLLAITLLQTYLVAIITSVFYITVLVQAVGWVYLLFPFGYVLISTLTGYKIAKPLIALNYLNQVKEAAFRRMLDSEHYHIVHDNNRQLYRKTKHLTYFQSFYSQVNVILPYIILASLYFSAKISFGVLMQIANVLSSLTDSLGTLITSFDKVNKFLSCRKRLKELRII